MDFQLLNFFAGEKVSMDLVHPVLSLLTVLWFSDPDLCCMHSGLLVEHCQVQLQPSSICLVSIFTCPCGKWMGTSALFWVFLPHRGPFCSTYLSTVTISVIFWSIAISLPFPSIGTYQFYCCSDRLFLLLTLLFCSELNFLCIDPQIIMRYSGFTPLHWILWLQCVSPLLHLFSPEQSMNLPLMPSFSEIPTLKFLKNA